MYRSQHRNKTERFYRVQSSSSITELTEEGLLAGDPDTWVALFPRPGAQTRMTRELFEDHLKWNNTTPSPFISTYARYETAKTEAVRRVESGEDDVRILTIEIEPDLACRKGGIWFRHVYDMKEELRVYIPDIAYHNARYEVLFANKIPTEFIVGQEMFD